MHQGDRNGVKGLYLVNIVDEVTQYEYVGAVPGISERFPVPLLEALLPLFPFTVLAFHADNGSEYINHRVAELLNKLHIPRFTKSRARRSNDNALVEGKNAHVVRKWFGHDHIPQRFAEAVNEFALRGLSPFLNFHRPCLFGTEYRDDRGRLRRKYRRTDVMTPYAKLKSLPGAGARLKDGATFADLDRSALAVSDLDAVRRVNDACRDPVPHHPSRAATRGVRMFRVGRPRREAQRGGVGTRARARHLDGGRNVGNQVRHNRRHAAGIPDGLAPFQHHVVSGQRSRRSGSA